MIDIYKYYQTLRSKLPTKICPKNTPTAATWWVVFCGLDLYKWAMSTIHSTLTAGGDWETNVKHSWRTLHRTFYEATAICPKNWARLWDQCKELFGEHSKVPFGRRKSFAAKNQEDKRVILPRDLYYAWWNLGGTSVKPWWSLGQPSTEPFKTQPCGSPRRTCSREPETRETWRVLVEAWWNLPWNLLAAQDRSAPEDQRHHETWRTLVWNLLAAQGGSAPENHRESESDSAPKPCLWLKARGMIMMDQRSDQTTLIDTFSRSDVMRLHVAPLLNIASIVFEEFPSAPIGMYPQMLSIR